jgi:hypothetical protein
MPANNTMNTSQLILISLLQAILYSSIWLWNEFVASYVTLVFPAMIAVILFLSAIADWIEPSRISKWYYVIMIVSIFIPILIGVTFYFI